MTKKEVLLTVPGSLPYVFTPSLPSIHPPIDINCSSWKILLSDNLIIQPKNCGATLSSKHIPS